MTDFDGLDYTRQAILEELALIERHARDGSAVEAGCGCIEEKHLLNLAGLASEGVTLATEKKEKEYYMGLASLARELRREVLDQEFNRFSSHGNPVSRAKILRECIESATVKCCGENTTDYSKCSCNPVEVCKASIEQE